jgi:hypothetical protein
MIGDSPPAPRFHLGGEPRQAGQRRPAPAIRDSSTSRALTTFEGLLAADVVTSVNGTVAA